MLIRMAYEAAVLIILMLVYAYISLVKTSLRQHHRNVALNSFHSVRLVKLKMDTRLESQWE